MTLRPDEIRMGDLERARWSRIRSRREQRLDADEQAVVDVTRRIADLYRTAGPNVAYVLATVWLVDLTTNQLLDVHNAITRELSCR